jgi:hypothetical protein
MKKLYGLNSGPAKTSNADLPFRSATVFPRVGGSSRHHHASKAMKEILQNEGLNFDRGRIAKSILSARQWRFSAVEKPPYRGLS